MAASAGAAATKTASQLLRVNFMTNQQKLHRGLWPWTVGLKARLPLHYKQRYVERWMQEPTPVHHRPALRKYAADEFGQPKPVEAVPIPVQYPKEAHEGLWGGEGLIVGFRKRKNNPMKPRVAKIWKPNLISRTLYSEILDEWMTLTVTVRTLDLIDAAYGFDTYILSTPEVDMHSRLGMRLKRRMLLALARRDIYPNDPAQRDTICEKYREYVLPEEEAEWVGLSLHEAERKQHEVEEEDSQRSIQPLKSVYVEELAQRLRATSVDERETSSRGSGMSWIKKLSPFQKEEKDEK